MREKWVFPDAALRWIEDKFDNDPEVQLRLNDRGSRSPNLDAALYLLPLFKAAFPDAYPGETDAEFKKRRNNLSGAERRAATKIPPETPGEFKTRMDRLLTVGASSWYHTCILTGVQDIRVRLKILRQRQKAARAKNATLPAWPAKPAPKRFRSLSGLDIYQRGHESPRGPMLQGSSQLRLDIGTDRRDAKARWTALSPEEQAPYIAEAEEENVRRALEQQDSQPVEDEEDPGA